MSTLSRNAAWCLLLVLTLTLALARDAHAALMPLSYEGRIVAGTYSGKGTINGFPDLSQMNNPSGLCGSYNLTDTASSSFLVGTEAFFRTFRREDMYLGTWFGRTVEPETTPSLSGPIADVVLGNPFGCIRVTQTNVDTVVIFFVTNDGYIRWVKDSQLNSFKISGDTYLAIALYNNWIYVFGQRNTMSKCQVNILGFPPLSNCASVPINTSIGKWGNVNVPDRGLVVNENGIFVATSESVNWLRLDGSFVADVKSAGFIDVHYRDGILFAANSSALFTIDVNTATNTLSSVVISGGMPGRVEGEDPRYASIYRIFPISRDEVYMTSSLAVMYMYYLPDMNVSLSLPRDPFPIGFVNEQDIMPSLYLTMAVDLADKLGQAGAKPNPKTGMVKQDTWDTDVVIDVPQRMYDTATTAHTIQTMAYPKTQTQLENYYKLTDECIYSDPNLLPMCDDTQMFDIEKDIAAMARGALKYPLIYTNPAQQVTINDNPNITSIKLLMPANFGNPENTPIDPATANTTTHELLDAFIGQREILDAVRAVYRETNKYTIQFPESEFHFIKPPLSEEDLQEARWIVQNLTYERLLVCKKASGGNDSDNSSGSEGHSGQRPNCTPIVGITNATLAENVLMNTTFEVFIPAALGFDDMGKTTIHKCLDGYDWGPLRDWLDQRPIDHKERKCGTGCIVGVAVAAAVVTAVLIVVVVVLTSKRRRLATVIIPATAAPKFSSTIDLDEASP